jgi:hypothetical protein
LAGTPHFAAADRVRIATGTHGRPASDWRAVPLHPQRRRPHITANPIRFARRRHNSPVPERATLAMLSVAAIAADNVLIFAQIAFGSPCLVGIVCVIPTPTKRRRLPDVECSRKRAEEVFCRSTKLRSAATWRRWCGGAWRRRSTGCWKLRRISSAGPPASSAGCIQRSRPGERLRVEVAPTS